MRKVFILICFTQSLYVNAQSVHSQKDIFYQTFKISVIESQLISQFEAYILQADTFYCLDEKENEELHHFVVSDTPLESIKDSTIVWDSLKIKLCDSEHSFFFNTSVFAKIHSYNIQSTNVAIEYRVYSILSENGQYRCQSIKCNFHLKNNQWILIDEESEQID